MTAIIAALPLLGAARAYLRPMLDMLSLYVLALLLGGMVMFSFVFSPLVFIKLPIETAGPFIRGVFPAYFAVVAGLFAVAALATFNWVAALMCALGLLNLFGLMPAINKLRDRQLAGDEGAKAWFDRLHRSSVVINFIQMAAAAYLIWPFAAG